VPFQPRRRPRRTCRSPCHDRAVAGGRLIAQKLTKTWEQQVIVDNHGGTTGSEVAAKSPPAGDRLLVGTSITHAIAPSL
jgi:tripartite-type tricarboxylate transporter receptor subunit TctC